MTSDARREGPQPAHLPRRSARNPRTLNEPDVEGLSGVSTSREEARSRARGVASARDSGQNPRRVRGFRSESAQGSRTPRRLAVQHVGGAERAIEDLVADMRALGLALLDERSGEIVDLSSEKGLALARRHIGEMDD